MYDFTGTFGSGDWGVTIGTTPGMGSIWGSGYPLPQLGYPYPPTGSTWSTNQNNQLLLLGLVVVAAVLLLKR